MRIAVDMDDVLVDTGAYKRALYANHGYDWSDADLRGKEYADLAKPEHARIVDRALTSGFPFANFAPMEGAVAAFHDLCDRYDVYIATAAMDYPASVSHKVAWVARHLPFFDHQRLVMCGNKGIIHADVLIDDSTRHFADFAGQGVVFTAHKNVTEDHPYRIDRWSEAADVIARLEAERS